jgi:hypothetical protein
MIMRLPAILFVTLFAISSLPAQDKARNGNAFSPRQALQALEGIAHAAIRRKTATP